MGRLASPSLQKVLGQVPPHSRLSHCSGCSPVCSGRFQACPSSLGTADGWCPGLCQLVPTTNALEDAITQLPWHLHQPVAPRAPATSPAIGGSRERLAGRLQVDLERGARLRMPVWGPEDISCSGEESLKGKVQGLMWAPWFGVWRTSALGGGNRLAGRLGTTASASQGQGARGSPWEKLGRYTDLSGCSCPGPQAQEPL